MPQRLRIKTMSSFNPRSVIVSKSSAKADASSSHDSSQLKDFSLSSLLSHYGGAKITGDALQQHLFEKRSLEQQNHLNDIGLSEIRKPQKLQHSSSESLQVPFLPSTIVHSFVSNNTQQTNYCVPSNPITEITNQRHSDVDLRYGRDSTTINDMKCPNTCLDVGEQHHASPTQQCYSGHTSEDFIRESATERTSLLTKPSVHQSHVGLGNESVSPLLPAEAITVLSPGVAKEYSNDTHSTITVARDNSPTTYFSTTKSSHSTSHNKNRRRNAAKNSWASASCCLRPMIQSRESIRRILDRDADFHQSEGRWNISRVNRSYELYKADIFHSLINLSTFYVVMIFCLIYILVILAFTPFYWLISDSCDLGIQSFRDSYYFSLQTIMTIGFGVPSDMHHSPYFNNCNSAMIFITLESLMGVLCDGLCVGMFFSRLARAQTRATTIVFSDFACISRIRGKLHLMFRVCELRKHQLLETHIRCYAITKFNGHIETRFMRLSKPDDELGGVLLLNFPATVVHDLNQWSPLVPPGMQKRYQKTLIEKWNAQKSTEKNIFCAQEENGSNPSVMYCYPDTFQREIDTWNGNRELMSGALSSLGCSTYATTSTKSFVESDTSASQNLSKETSSKHSQHQEEEERSQHFRDKIETQQFLRDHSLEIIVLVEGIDPTSSSTVQARHSYVVSDIKWDEMLAPCVSEREDGGAQIDFSLFHDTIPLPSWNVKSLHTGSDP